MGFIHHTWPLLECHLCKGVVTNYGEGGGYKTGGGGTGSFTPTKRGGGKSFSHSEGGAQKVLG